MKLKNLFVSLLLVGTTGVAHAAMIEINELVPGVSCTLSANEWCIGPLAGSGTIGIVDLTGSGGNLENNQPLPVGAVRLTTDANNADRAEAGTALAIDANDFLTGFQVGYDYYKEAAGNLAAAPSLKLALYNSVCTTGDCYGQLVYEPTWNKPGGGTENPPTGAWQSIVIDTNTGSGETTSGGWWWTGGFGQGNTAGGPPIRSMGEWNALFNNDFNDALVVGLSIGIGTYNQSNIGYFDNVSYGTGSAMPTTFNFEPNSVPEPGTMALLVLSLAGIGFNKRKTA